MKKCNGIAIIDDSRNTFKLISFSVINSKNVNIPLVRDNNKPYVYNNLSDLLHDIRNIAKNNGYDFRIYDRSFDTVWYTCDIYFLSNLSKSRRYSKLTFDNKLY